jgi:hypothetical protein
MIYGIKIAKQAKLKIEYRSLDEDTDAASRKQNGLTS